MILISLFLPSSLVSSPENIYDSKQNPWEFPAVLHFVHVCCYVGWGREQSPCMCVFARVCVCVCVYCVVVALSAFSLCLNWHRFWQPEGLYPAQTFIRRFCLLFSLWHCKYLLATVAQVISDEPVQEMSVKAMKLTVRN